MSIRPMRKSLRTFSSDLHSEFLDEEAAGLMADTSKSSQIVDFGSAGLYIGGLQIIAGVVVASCVSILSCWLLPSSVVSGVRTLVVTTALSFVVVFKAVRIGRVRGVSMLFAALRPCVFIYLLALTLEELGHGGCRRNDDNDAHATVRRVVYHIATVLMLVSAFVRAQSPRNESDIPFVLTLVSLGVVAVLPMPSSSSHGPLSETPRTLIDAGERVLRAVLFSFAYAMHTYASAPSRNIGSELLVCVGRATAASVWILCVSPILLVAFPFQVALCVGMSVRGQSFSSSSSSSRTFPYENSEDDRNALRSTIEYESIPRYDNSASMTGLKMKQPMRSQPGLSSSSYSNNCAIVSSASSASNASNCGTGNVLVQANDSDTEEAASMSCSSDVELDLSTGVHLSSTSSVSASSSSRRYGAFVPIVGSNAVHQPTAGNFSFSFAQLKRVSSPSEEAVASEEMLLASAIAREAG